MGSKTQSFGQALLLALSKTYALRMGAVFMISLATIWLKTGLMPKWLVGVTYLVAVGLIVSADVSMWLTMAFPIWVLVVSVLLLMPGRRHRPRPRRELVSSNRKACEGQSLTASRALSTSSAGISSTSTTTMPSSS